MKNKRKDRKYCSGGKSLVEVVEIKKPNFIRHDLIGIFEFAPVTLKQKERCPVCNRRMKVRAQYIHDGCRMRIMIPEHKTRF